MRGQTPPRRHATNIILKKSKALLRDGAPTHADITLLTAPADATPEIKSHSVDLVVTSPPFLDVVDYAGDNWLRCWFAGIEASGVAIAMHRKEQDWVVFVRDVFGELARTVRPGGHVAFEVGEVRGGSVALEALVLQAMATLPFTPHGVLVNVQEFTKTANCWGVANNAKGTNSNRVVIAQRNSGSVLRATATAFFHEFAQHLRGTERHHAARRDRHFLARLRIAADALTLGAHIEVPEARQLHGIAVDQRVLHHFEHAREQAIGVGALHVGAARQRFDQIGACDGLACHRSPLRRTPGQPRDVEKLVVP